MKLDQSEIEFLDWLVTTTRTGRVCPYFLALIAEAAAEFHKAFGYCPQHFSPIHNESGRLVGVEAKGDGGLPNYKRSIH